MNGPTAPDTTTPMHDAPLEMSETSSRVIHQITLVPMTVLIWGVEKMSYTTADFYFNNSRAFVNSFGFYD